MRMGSLRWIFSAQLGGAGANTCRRAARLTIDGKTPAVKEPAQQARRRRAANWIIKTALDLRTVFADRPSDRRLPAGRWSSRPSGSRAGMMPAVRPIISRRRTSGALI